jgi:copper(I)-binding protein
MIRTLLFAVATLAAFTLAARAEDFAAGSLRISSPWARATPKGASVGGGYMTITNTGTAPDRLIGGSTGIAKGFEVHEMKMDGGVMKMRPVVGGLEINPGQTVKLDPSGYHVMFTGLKDQLKQGEHFKATLDFEKAGKVSVEFTVEGIGATAPTGDHAPPGAQMDHGRMQMK